MSFSLLKNNLRRIFLVLNFFFIKKNSQGTVNNKLPLLKNVCLSVYLEVFYLNFSKAMILDSSSFVYYSQLENVIFTEHTQMSWGINRGIKSLSQHFEKEIYHDVNITRLLFTGKHLFWSLFLTEYC